jgi:enoyl-CoA hydratase/carnithine racemase
MTDAVTAERRDDGVCVVRIDRPKMNALSASLLDELAAVAEGLVADPPGAVVVWGGERVFAAGADVAEFVDAGALVGPDEARAIAGRFRRALDAVAAIPCVVIAAVNGYALGGGCELALACDLRVAADTAKFGQPEVLLGIVPGGGGSQRLPRLVGAGRALEIMVTGRQVDAEEALRIGLANRVVPAADVFDDAIAWAAELAAGPRLAHAAIKRAVTQGMDGPLAAGLDLEGDEFVASFATDDAHTGVTAFLERRPGKPSFSGS